MIDSMRPSHDPVARGNARALRHHMEPAEVVLWSRLRRSQLGTRFRRQQPLLGYIVDFVAMKHRLVVELDGTPHESSLDDIERDRQFYGAGFRVFRFWNDDMKNDPDWVVAVIRRGLAEPAFVHDRDA